MGISQLTVDSWQLAVGSCQLSLILVSGYFVKGYQLPFTNYHLQFTSFQCSI
jgi:hypothetical protein